MKTVGLFALLCLGSVPPTIAQEAEGVHFEEGLSWLQVLAKAKAANKPIFVDCYATWCEPCKWMDKNVYPDPAVAAYFNEHYISVRVQMDMTKHDSPLVQSWRAEAEWLKEQCKIAAYPSLLFFSPEGKALHKGVGAMAVKKLLALAQDAANPDKQYFTQLDRYQANKDYAQVPALVKLAQDAGDEESGNSIALDYIDHHLASLKDEELLAMVNADNIIFVAAYNQAGQGDPVLGSSGRLFHLLYSFAGQSPSVTGAQNLARGFVNHVITTEEVYAKIYEGTGKQRRSTTDHPDWPAMATAIESKYGKLYAERIIPRCQSDWYLKIEKDYNTAARYYLDLMDKPGMAVTSGPDSHVISLNGFLWDVVFGHCTDPVVLERAIPLARRVADDNPEIPNVTDTLANLLYKAGHTQEAIALEEKAAGIEDAQAAERSAKSHRTIIPDKGYRETVDKMKQGLPTWENS